MKFWFKKLLNKELQHNIHHIKEYSNEQKEQKWKQITKTVFELFALENNLKSQKITFLLNLKIKVVLKIKHNYTNMNVF
jgi:hypothetical protein